MMKQSEGFLVRDSLGNEMITTYEHINEIRILERIGNKITLLYKGVKEEASIITSDPDKNSIQIIVRDRVFNLQILDGLSQKIEAMGMNNLEEDAAGEVHSPMPGLVVHVHVQAGDSVEKGDPVITLEAMKMENLLMAPISGKVQSIQVKNGESVDKNTLLLTIE